MNSRHNVCLIAKDIHSVWLCSSCAILYILYHPASQPTEMLNALIVFRETAVSRECIEAFSKFCPLYKSSMPRCIRIICLGIIMFTPDIIRSCFFYSET